jgi:hypothetical protein
MIESSGKVEPEAESLIEPYREMAADEDCEEEAPEWCEALIADAPEPNDSECFQ